MKERESTSSNKINLFPKKTIFVSVTKSMKGAVHGITSATPLVDMARGCWFVNSNKVNQCELLVAVNKGFIVDVWEIDKRFPWRTVTPNAISTRVLTNTDHRRKYCEVKKTIPSQGGLYPRQKISSIPGLGRMYGPVMYNF